ncbi:MAG TPA: Smr/MutS family protein [Bacteroidales bacterium]|nr:Smr/MutS family protein [Bacteroidales bacterium]
MYYPENFEMKTGFDRIREMVRENCLCDLGVSHVNAMQMTDSFEIISLLLDETAEFRNICLYEENFPVDNYLDVTQSLKKSRVEGAWLEAEEVFNLKRSLEAIKSVLRFFKVHEEKGKYPVLRRLAGNVNYFPFVLEKIDTILTKTGRIKDNASAELSKIRKEIILKHSQVNKRLESILKNAQQSGIAEPDAALTLRDGRLVIPVAAANKRKISGFIHDESATGKTVYIEPSDVVELNNEIKELEYAELREIIKILTRFTDTIRPYLDDLDQAYSFLGYIDFLRAKALFAIKTESARPEIRNTQAFSWIQSIHPLLYLSHQKINKEVVPLDIRLDEQNRILVISGPNAGGKSVCLQTVGLLQYMMQCGMLVPMNIDSSMGIFSKIFIDIGDEQSLENDLSTYSSHLLNLKYFIRHSDSKALILIDELGSGTEPMLGGAIAEAFLERINQQEVYGVITTHYANLKHYASSAKGVINGAMLFDTAHIRPLFRLEIGKPGSSFAIDIARKIGLPEDILKNASDRIGQEHIRFDKHLREIIRDKRYWEEKRNRIRIAEKKLRSVIDQYTEELKNAKKQQKEIVAQARQQAEELLAGINKEIENTIRVIRETQADKEKTKAARKNLEAFRNTLESKDDSQNKVLEEKIANAERLRKKLGADEQPEELRRNLKDDGKIKTGDKVRIVNQEAIGEVLDVSGDSIMVAFGNMITTVKEVRLLKVSEDEVKKSVGFSSQTTFGYNLSERKLNFKPDIDIRGKRAEEAIEIVKKFVDEAVMVSARDLRILHGKGDGILRQVIRDYLHTIDVVKSCKDENIERGGAGITLVELDF